MDNSRKVTIKDVAKSAGVSIATVSRVVNDNGFVSEENKERVQGAIKSLNYQRNAVARSLKQDKTYIIGVIIPDITNPYFMTISRGIEDTIHQNGYNIIFCSSDENPAKERMLLNLLTERRVDAIVLATSGKNEEIIKKIVVGGIPIVLVDRRVEIPGLDLDLVAEDNLQGAYELAHYLIKEGHTRIGLVNGLLEVSTGIDRYAGFRKALEHAGLEEEQKLVINGSFTSNGGRNAVESFLNMSSKPTAILSLNNSMTFGVLLALSKRRLRIGTDMVVASYGEVEAVQLLDHRGGMVYLSQFPYEMGVRLGEILLDRVKHAKQESVHCIFHPALMS